jgi:trk system potassium uptake protein TrkH
MTVSKPSRSPVRQSWPINPAGVLFFAGVTVCFFGMVMLVPAAIDIVDGNEDAEVFMACAFISLFSGSCLAIANRRAYYGMELREVILAVPATWLAIAAFGSLPLMFSQYQLSFTDAFFESMSGLTATGATVITGLDAAPRGLLMWRFMIVWFGGFGVMTLAVLVLPFLRIGGLQMFTIDLSAQAGKFLPRMIDVVVRIGLVYVALTIACAVAFRFCGMNAFDAIGHAMSAIATGGFSSHDAGIGFFKSSSVEWTASVFMLLGAMPFVLHFQALRQGPRVLFGDTQVRLFLLIVAAMSLSVAIWRFVRDDLFWLDSLREAVFNVVSIISTTGFTSQDFSLWGGYPLLVLLVAMLAGGCTGSTAGGVKMFRIAVLLQTVRAQVHRQIYPRGTFVVSYNNREVPESVRQGVVNYFFVYLTTFFLVALALAFTGLTLEESLSASATALGGVGPGFGPVIGPCCNYGPIPSEAKWILTGAMLAGRLEILTLLIPLTRTFWRG